MKALKITASFTDRDSVALTKYLNDISKYQPVSAEKEAELAKKIKNGDEKALTELVCANLRFVVSVAKQYQNRGVALIDLINQGNMGLMKAAKRFDETRGFKFISFAVWWVRQSIIELINENGKIVRIPVNKTNLANKYVKTFADLEQKLERTPTDEEVLDAMGIDDTFDEDYLTRDDFNLHKMIIAVTAPGKVLQGCSDVLC
jgi:RNA polymerase primary sigma factor